jgi:hypothetical protein
MNACESGYNRFQCIEMYYNWVCRHSTIDSLAPIVFEDQYKMAAWACLLKWRKIRVAIIHRRVAGIDGIKRFV